MNVFFFDNFVNIFLDQLVICYYNCLNISRVVFNFNEEWNYYYFILVYLLNLVDMRLFVYEFFVQNREELVCSYFFIFKFG